MSSGILHYKTGVMLDTPEHILSNCVHWESIKTLVINERRNVSDKSQEQVKFMVTFLGKRQVGFFIYFFF